MFTKFSDDNKAQALVHPNSNVPASFKLKHFEFVGKLVGKCLYESSIGAGYRQFVKVESFYLYLMEEHDQWHHDEGHDQLKVRVAKIS